MIELLDPALLAKMTDPEFAAYWDSLGRAIRQATLVSHAPAATRTEVPCVAASAERAWSPRVDAPAPAIGFGAHFPPS